MRAEEEGTDRRIDRKTDERMEGETNRWRDGQIVRPTNGHDKQMEEQ